MGACSGTSKPINKPDANNEKSKDPAPKQPIQNVPQRSQFQLNKNYNQNMNMNKNMNMNTAAARVKVEKQEQIGKAQKTTNVQHKVVKQDPHAAEHPNNKENVAVSWLNASRTPEVSKVNQNGGIGEADRNQQQFKSSKIYQKNQPQMKPIQEQPAGQSSFSKPNSSNNGSKFAGVASNDFKKGDNSTIRNKHQKDDLERMISNEPQYGGASISDIKKSNLNSNIQVNKSNVGNQHEVGATNHSGEAAADKLQPLNMSLFNLIKNTKLDEKGDVVAQQDIIRDENNDAPLMRISWTSQLNIK